MGEILFLYLELPNEAIKTCSQTPHATAIQEMPLIVAESNCTCPGAPHSWKAGCTLFHVTAGS